MNPLNPTLNHTHSPAATSWLASANGHPDFSIQNLPYAVFAEKGDYPRWRAGVAIGDQVLDLAALQNTNLLNGSALSAIWMHKRLMMIPVWYTATDPDHAGCKARENNS